MMSRHHWSIVRAMIKIPNFKTVIPYPWNQAARPEVKARAPKEPVSGHGLGSTRWKGCRTIISFK